MPEQDMPKKCNCTSKNICDILISIIITLFIVYMAVGVILFIFGLIYNGQTSSWEEVTLVLISKTVKPFDCAGYIDTFGMRASPTYPTTFTCNTTNYQNYLWFTEANTYNGRLACETSPPTTENIIVGCKCCGIYNNETICTKDKGFIISDNSDYRICSPIISSSIDGYDNYVVGNSYNVWHNNDNGLLYLHLGYVDHINDEDEFHYIKRTGKILLIIGIIACICIFCACIIAAVLSDK